MAELVPIPLSALARRLDNELDRGEGVFDLPRRKFFAGSGDLDTGVTFHGRRAAAPLGPAAGPHTQMAQNLVLSWLGGARILELKTVQVRDDLAIPRPCIDMRTVGYNAEWSQELRLEQSLEEYVKGAFLIAMLRESGRLDLPAGAHDTIFDTSVGYDLDGIRSPGVDAFLRGIRDTRPVMARLRREVPPALARYRDAEVPDRLSDTLTLSTFHGCPPVEIERIILHLLEVHRFHCVVKWNPMLLGPRETRRLLAEMGYADLRVPESAFARDTRWEEAVGIVERLAARARELGLGFGVKFSNTLIVENTAGFLPASEREVYLSGPPLHVLAMHLVARFRAHFGDAVPISFAAGVDAVNYPDAVALGLVPVTVCSDLLRPGGYGRLSGYARELRRRMSLVGARTVDEFVVRAYGHGGTVSEARCRNTGTYVAGLAANPRYGAAANAHPPRKIGRRLWRFDCISCDKCVPVCPNDALFTFRLREAALPAATLRRGAGGWTRVARPALALAEDHQIAVFADACNACGNCDVFCPEDGGPYVEKPCFFGSEAAFERAAPLPGFYVERTAARDLVRGRLAGPGGAREYRLLESRLESGEREGIFSGSGFAVRWRGDGATVEAADPGVLEIDLGVAHLLAALRDGVLDPASPNPVNSLVEPIPGGPMP
jgi:putative selenate reductase